MVRLSDDEIKILVSHWAQGHDREDIEKFPIGEFNEWRSVVACLRDGNDDELIDTLIASKLIRQFAELPPDSDVLYRSALMGIHRKMMADEVSQLVNPKPSDLRELADKYDTSYMSLPEPNDIVNEFINEMDKRKNEDVIKSGITELDEVTFGIHNGQLTAIGARPGTGKSAFMLQVALKVAAKGHKVLYLPLEMTATETMERIILSRTQTVESKSMRTGDLSQENWSEIGDVMGHEDVFRNLMVYVGCNNIETIRGLIQTKEPALVIIDQLSQLTCSNQFYSIRERFTYMTKTLKAMALQEDVPIWLACQLNRNSKTTGEVSMEYLKESGSIEEDADNVILMWINEEKTKEQDMVRDKVVNISLAKQRQGPSKGWEMIFRSNNFTFEDPPPDGFMHNEKEEEF